MGACVWGNALPVSASPLTQQSRTADGMSDVVCLRPFLSSPLFQSDDDDDARLTDAGSDARRLLLQLSGDIWSLLHRFRDHVQQPVCLEESSGDGETMHQSVVYSLTVAVLICFRCKTWDIAFFMPSVHSHMFALQQFLPFVTALFESSEPEVNQKGLFILNRLLHNVGEGAIPEAFCDLLTRYPVPRSLVRVVRFSSDASCRKKAVATFKRLVCAFDPAGRVKIITVLIADPKQFPGVIELLLQQYRHFMTHDTSGSYAGRNLKAVVVNSIAACFRNADATSSIPSQSLISNSESILALLNLIRFLCLSTSLKQTGIREMAPMVRDRLIAPLKQELSTNREKLVHDLHKTRKLDSKSKSDAVDHLKNMQIQIGNDANAESVVHDCPDDFEEQGVQTALIKIDMIDSVVDRVKELLT